jgi:transposase
MLIAIKKREPESLSQKELAKICKYNPNSISVWRNLYLTGGIEAIMQHNWTGTKSKHISKEQYDYLSKKLNNPTNGLVGYKELLNWVETDLGISMKYTTLYEYVKRNFATKIKVARKSHIKKNEEDLIAFKKNS